jgi:hypothetical protein
MNSVASKERMMTDVERKEMEDGLCEQLKITALGLGLIWSCNSAISAVTTLKVLTTIAS